MLKFVFLLQNYSGSMVFYYLVTQSTSRQLLKEHQFVKKLYFSRLNHRITYTSITLFLFICFWSERVSQKYYHYPKNPISRTSSYSPDKILILSVNHHNRVAIKLAIKLVPIIPSCLISKTITIFVPNKRTLLQVNSCTKLDLYITSNNLCSK